MIKLIFKIIFLNYLNLDEEALKKEISKLKVNADNKLAKRKGGNAMRRGQ